MKSEEGKRLALVDYILKVAVAERQVEVRRQQLCIKKDFQPYVAFRRISRDGSYSVTGPMIHKFLVENAVEVNLRDCQSFVERYDVDGDGVLSYKEFAESLLPKEHPELRTFVSQQDCYSVSSEETLCYDTESKLIKLLAEEVNIFDHISIERDILLRQKGLTTSRIISLVDSGSKQNLNFNNIQSLVNLTGVLPYDAEIINFIRRLDKDGDGVINQAELGDFLNEYRTVARDTPDKREQVRSQRLRSDSSKTLSEDKVNRLSPSRQVTEIRERRSPVEEPKKYTRPVVKEYFERTIERKVNKDREDRSPVYQREEARSVSRNRSNYPLQSTSRRTQEPVESSRVEQYKNLRRIEEPKQRSGANIDALKLSVPQESYRRTLESQISDKRTTPQKNRYHREQTDPEEARRTSPLQQSNRKVMEDILGSKRSGQKREDPAIQEEPDYKLENLKKSSKSPNQDKYRNPVPRDLSSEREARDRREPLRDHRAPHQSRYREDTRQDNIFKQNAESNQVSDVRSEKGSDLNSNVHSKKVEPLGRPTYSHRRESTPESPSKSQRGASAVEMKSSESLFKAFKMMLNQERNLELARRELVTRNDFDVGEVFSMIDKRNRSWFTIEDFRVFLNEIGLKNIETRALIDLYSSYDTNQSCLLNFEQLVSMLCPLDQKFAVYMNKTENKVAFI